MQRAFTVDNLRFENDPGAEDLTWLLGSTRHAQIRLVETPNLLEAKPQAIPMRFAAPWIVLVATVVSWGFWSNVASVPLRSIAIGAVWFLVLPFLMFLLTSLNRDYRKQGYYFRADKLGRTIQLRQLGKAFDREAIISFTDLSRWYRPPPGGWDWIRQTGVLVRNGDGSVTHYPVVHEVHLRLFNNGISEQLAQIFSVEVRRIKLNRRESRNLRDC